MFSFIFFRRAQGISFMDSQFSLKCPLAHSSIFDEVLSFSLTTSVLCFFFVFGTFSENHFLYFCDEEKREEKIFHQKKRKSFCDENKSINGWAFGGAAPIKSFVLICLVLIIIDRNATRNIFTHFYRLGWTLFTNNSRIRQKTFNDGNSFLALATRLCVVFLSVVDMFFSHTAEPLAFFCSPVPDAFTHFYCDLDAQRKEREDDF